MYDLAALAPAPYVFLGLETADDRGLALAERNFNAVGCEDHTDTDCGGTCDLCDKSINDVYIFRAGNGQKIRLGCDCAEKALDATDGTDNAKRKFRRVASAHKKAKRKAAEARRVEIAAESVQANAERLASLPHPNAYRAEKGATLLDWAAWMLANAGTAGKLKVGREVKKALAA